MCEEKKKCRPSPGEEDEKEEVVIIDLGVRDFTPVLKKVREEKEKKGGKED